MVSTYEKAPFSSQVADGNIEPGGFTPDAAWDNKYADYTEANPNTATQQGNEMAGESPEIYLSDEKLDKMARAMIQAAGIDNLNRLSTVEEMFPQTQKVEKQLSSQALAETVSLEVAAVA